MSLCVLDKAGVLMLVSKLFRPEGEVYCACLPV